jgi:CheY-like chemotaxis protein/nitrogen-specific signal transduction histidine kinase
VYTMIVREMSARRQTEADLQAQSRALLDSQREAEHASRVKSEFLASMSHELRTPMNSIMGFTGRLLRKLGDSLPERELDALQTIDRNSRHLLGLINSILDLSKIEAGKMELRLARFDLVESVREVAAQAAPLIDGKSLRIELELPHAPLDLDADPNLIRQVLTNLLSNGIKYTDQGSVTIALGTVDDPRLGRAACLAVRDTGVGIRIEDRARLFQHFTQLDSGSTRRVGGTGLGLVIAERMVRMHGGRIDVESTLGVGSTFTVMIPLNSEDARPSSASEDQSSPDTLPGRSPTVRPTGKALIPRGLTILCVDDDPDVLKYLRLTFEDAGYGVLSASSHDEAIDGARQHGPDLICLDLAMPGKDGYDVMRSLRANPTTSAVPIVVVSVSADEARRLGSGARRYLAKPVDAADLVDAVREILAPGVSDALIVEDDPDVSRLLSETLLQHGISVRAAFDGRQGLDQLAVKPPAVILLDLMMPVMDGFTFLEQIERDPRWSQIPVIVLTARSLSSDEVAELARVCSAVVAKGRDDTECIVDTILQAVLPRRRDPARLSKEAISVP